jgi:hypothetical protein
VEIGVVLLGRPPFFARPEKAFLISCSDTYEPVIPRTVGMDTQVLEDLAE